MSDGYTPVFATVFDGSLCGKWPDTAVWLTMLALCDKRGNVDMSYYAIVGRTGWPIDLLRQGITALMQPDSESRSPAEDGRRLVPLDPSRGWGWHVVNHAVYREKARLQAKDAARTASGADAERKRAEREVSPEVPRTPPELPGVPLSDSNANTDSNEEKKTRSKTRSSARSTEFPEGFELDAALRDQALGRFPDCDVETAFAQFRARHQAKGTKFVNWRQAWTSWIGNFEQYGYPKLKTPKAGAMVINGKPVEWQ